MLPDRVSNPGPLTYESGALPIALRGPTYMLQDNLEPGDYLIILIFTFAYLFDHFNIYSCLFQLVLTVPFQSLFD